MSQRHPLKHYTEEKLLQVVSRRTQRHVCCTQTPLLYHCQYISRVPLTTCPAGSYQSSLIQVLWLSLAPGFWAGHQYTRPAGGEGNPGTTKPRSPRQHLPTVITGSLTVCGVGNCRQCNGMGVHFQLHLCPGNAEHADGAIAVPCHYMLALSSPRNNGMRLPGQALAALQSNQDRDPMTQ